MHPTTTKPHAGLSRLRPLWSLARPYGWQWALALLFLVLAAASTLAVPLAFRDLIDRGLSAESLHAPFVTLMGIAVLVAAFTSLRFYLMSWLGERVVADLRKRVYGVVLGRPPVFFETLQTGEVLSRLTADTTLVQSLVGTSISMALRSLVMLTGGVIMMLVTAPKLAALMVGLLVIVILPVLGMGRKVRRMSKDSQDRVADTSALAGEVLNAMQTVQAFGREAYERDRYGHEVERAFSTARKRIRSRSLMTAVAIVLAFGVIVFVLWLSAQAKAEGHMTAGELAQFILYATLTAGAIAALAEVWGEVQRASGATERLVELMRNPEPEDSRDVVRARTGPDAVSSIVLPIEVCFEEVRFAYPSRPDHWVLNGLNLKVPAGQTLALVGHSGAGKSTVLQLLLGFYRPQSGRILMNGRDLWDLGPVKARALMGLVPQDPVVFSGDAWANIRYGDLEATDPKVLEAARAAHADEFLSALPEGYSTFLGERGLRLSGGQRQRLAIARAILRNPPILLLDEATSALDTLSERAVQAALEALLPGRTAVVVAHRLSTVRKAHLIAVLDQGRCIALGSHDALRGSSPLYAALCAEQFVDEASQALA